jgi:hypothetical protein
VSVFPRKKDDGWQAGDDATLQDQYRRAHQPIQGHDAGRVILAGLAPFGARQTFEHPALGVLALLALLTNQIIFFGEWILQLTAISAS